MQSIISYKELIEKELNLLDFHFEPANLYEPMTYILSLGGKRMRPTLCLMAAELFGLDKSGAISQALAVEIFHNFTLVHDDIMDEAPIRRGKTTVHKKWDQNIAILSGDAMFVKAYELLVDADPKLLPSLLKIFNRTAIEVCEGQQYDMDFEAREDVSIDEYLKMIELKTAVLLGGALQLGAIIAEAPVHDQELIYAFGKNIGLAFQLQDDILDVYADPEKFGKQVGGDIISNKKTFLLLKALELADENQKEELNKWIDLPSGDFDPEEKVNAVKLIFDALNVKDLAQTKMDEYFQVGMEALQKVNVSKDKKETLEELAEQLMVRDI